MLKMVPRCMRCLAPNKGVEQERPLMLPPLPSLCNQHMKRVPLLLLYLVYFYDTCMYTWVYRFRRSRVAAVVAVVALGSASEAGAGGEDEGWGVGWDVEVGC